MFYFRILNSILLNYMCIFISISYSHDYWRFLKLHFKVSRLFWFPWFQYELWDQLIYFCKETRWNFVCIESVDPLSKCCHLNNRKSSNPWTQVVFSFIWVFFNLFNIFWDFKCRILELLLLNYTYSTLFDEWKSWLKAQQRKNEDHGIRSHHFMANR